MNVTKFLPLVLTPLLLAASFPERSGGTTPASEAAESVASGPLRGRWDSAGAVTPGRVRGRLLSERGRLIATLDAAVVRGLPLVPSGVLVGSIEVERGPHAGAKLPLRGTWVERSRGKGAFRAVALRRASSRAPRVELRLTGQFFDTSGPRPGILRGRWHEPARP